MIPQIYPRPAGLLSGRSQVLPLVIGVGTLLILELDIRQIILERGFSIAIYNGTLWYVCFSLAPATIMFKSSGLMYACTERHGACARWRWRENPSSFEYSKRLRYSHESSSYQLRGKCRRSKSTSLRLILHYASCLHYWLCNGFS